MSVEWTWAEALLSRCNNLVLYDDYTSYFASYVLRVVHLTVNFLRSSHSLLNWRICVP